MTMAQEHSTLESLKRAITGAIEKRFGVAHPELNVYDDGPFAKPTSQARGAIIQVEIPSTIPADPLRERIAASSGRLTQTANILITILNWQRGPIVRGNDSLYSGTLYTFVSDLMAWIQHNDFTDNDLGNDFPNPNVNIPVNINSSFFPMPKSQLMGATVSFQQDITLGTNAFEPVTVGGVPAIQFSPYIPALNSITVGGVGPEERITG